MLLDLHEVKKLKINKIRGENQLNSSMQTNRCDDSHENSANAPPISNDHRNKLRKILVFVIIIDFIVSTTQESLFTFRYKI